jgi:pyruvate dehydrogenase E1 component alpha subunit
MFDAELYREKKEVEEWKKRDPISSFQELLLQQKLLTDEDYQAMEKQVEQEVEQAVAFAESCSFEPVEELLRYTYSERAN